MKTIHDENKISDYLKIREEEFDNHFRIQFINDHNGEWRPLRGLWMEDIFDYFHKENLKTITDLISLVREKTIDECVACVPEKIDLSDEWATALTDFNTCREQIITNLYNLKNNG